MKTFSRGPKKVRDHEMTSTTQEMNSESPSRNDFSYNLHVRGSDNPYALGSSAILPIENGKLAAEVASPTNGLRSKRKYNAEIVFTRRKAGRLESSRADSERRNGVPGKEEPLPATEAASHSELRSGSGPLITHTAPLEGGDDPWRLQPSRKRPQNPQLYAAQPGMMGGLFTTVHARPEGGTAGSPNSTTSPVGFFLQRSPGRSLFSGRQFTRGRGGDSNGVGVSGDGDVGGTSTGIAVISPPLAMASCAVTAGVSGGVGYSLEVAKVEFKCVGARRCAPGVEVQMEAAGQDGVVEGGRPSERTLLKVEEVPEISVRQRQKRSSSFSGQPICRKTTASPRRVSMEPAAVHARCTPPPQQQQQRVRPEEDFNSHTQEEIQPQLSLFRKASLPTPLPSWPQQPLQQPQLQQSQEEQIKRRQQCPTSVQQTTTAIAVVDVAARLEDDIAPFCQVACASLFPTSTSRAISSSGAQAGRNAATAAPNAARSSSGRASRPIGGGRLPTGPPPTGLQTPMPFSAAAAAAGGLKARGTSSAVAAAAAAGTAKGTAQQKSTPRNFTDATDARLGTRGASGGTASNGITPGGAAAAMVVPSQGGGSGRLGSRGESDVGSAAAAAAAAQSILEAQERGELLQMQDDAQYALDGLASAEKIQSAAAAAAISNAAAGTAGTSTAAFGSGTSGGAIGVGVASGALRESVVALAVILASRRGRAALSPPANLAMKALTSLARLHVVPRDPVVALAAAIILLSLVQEDALPSYGASIAAAVLIRHVLLQAEQDPPPVLQPRQQGFRSEATAAWALLRDARMGPEAVCSGTGGGDGVVLRLLRLVQEGSLGRQVVRADLVEGALPLVLLAMVTASEAAAAKIKFTERFKDNMSKLGTLPLLGRLVAVRRDAVVRHMQDRRSTAATVATAATVTAENHDAPSNAVAPDPMNLRPQTGPGNTGCAAGPALQPISTDDAYLFVGSQPYSEPQSQFSHGRIHANPPPLLTEPSELSPLPLSCLWELQLLLRVLENTTFAHKSNEAELLALQVCTAVPLENAAAVRIASAAVRLPPHLTPLSQQAPVEVSSSQTLQKMAVGSQPIETDSQPMVGSQSSSQQGLELLIDMPKQASDDNTAAAVEAGVPFIAVVVDVVRQLSNLVDCGGGGGGGGGGGQKAAAAPPAVPVPPSATAVCQVGVSVLMNLTHEHADGVAAVAAAGGLEAVGGLVWRCCQPHLVETMAAAPGASQWRLHVCRDSVVSSIEILSVGLGLLINLTSHSAANQRALRSVILEAPALLHSQPASPPASITPLSQGAEQGYSGVIAATQAPRMVPLLCALLNAMSRPAHATPYLFSRVCPTAASKAPLHGCLSTELQHPSQSEDTKCRDGDGGGAAGSGGDGRYQELLGEDVVAWAGKGNGGGNRQLGRQSMHGGADEVTEAALEEDEQGGQASIAQVYSAILLGYLVGGSDADVDVDVDCCSASAARAEARCLLECGSLRPLAQGISRCLAFYCRAGAITEVSKDALAGLLRRLLRLEEIENPAAAAMEMAHSREGTEGLVTAGFMMA